MIILKKIGYKGDWLIACPELNKTQKKNGRGRETDNSNSNNKNWTGNKISFSVAHIQSNKQPR